MVCELFAEGAAHVRSPGHIYAHLVCKPFGLHVYTGPKMLVARGPIEMFDNTAILKEPKFD